jgi:hypothetical protein
MKLSHLSICMTILIFGVLLGYGLCSPSNTYDPYVPTSHAAHAAPVHHTGSHHPAGPMDNCVRTGMGGSRCSNRCADRASYIAGHNENHGFVKPTGHDGKPVWNNHYLPALSGM